MPRETPGYALNGRPRMRSAQIAPARQRTERPQFRKNRRRNGWRQISEQVGLVVAFFVIDPVDVDHAYSIGMVVEDLGVIDGLEAVI